MEKIQFDVTIYTDALSLLLSDKIDIKEAMVKEQMAQGCEDFDNAVVNALTDEEEEVVIKTEKSLDDVIKVFEEASIDDLMNFITVDEEAITCNYGESYECDDRRVVAFRIPCEFDAEQWLAKVK